MLRLEPAKEIDEIEEMDINEVKNYVIDIDNKIQLLEINKCKAENMINKLNMTKRGKEKGKIKYITKKNFDTEYEYTKYKDQQKKDTNLRTQYRFLIKKYNNEIDDILYDNKEIINGFNELMDMDNSNNSDSDDSNNSDYD